MEDKWIDRYFYKLYHPEVPESDEVHVGFCPEGAYHPGDMLQQGDWKKTIIEVETRYKRANEHKTLLEYTYFVLRRIIA